MLNVPEKCVKCGQNWHDVRSCVSISYNAINEELVVKCGRCGYITCCDPDDKEIDNADTQEK